MKKIGLILAAVTGCGLLLTACGSGQTPADGTVNSSIPSVTQTDYGSEHTIMVNSTEKVTVIPDIAEVVFAVRTESDTAADCQRQNTENVNKVIETLKGQNIGESSIQTSDYSMYPIYTYTNNTQRITGYEATTVLTVSDLPIDGLGSILSQSVSSGINNVQSISYMSSQYDLNYQEALKLAVASANTKAQALAEASGCALGVVVNIVENSNYGEARYADQSLMNRMNAKEDGMMSTAMDTDANIMPGEIAVEVNITVEYQIN